MRANGIWRLRLAAGLLGAGLAVNSAALAGTITIDDDAGAVRFEAQLNGLMNRYTSESAAYLAKVDSSGSSFQLFYNPVEERNLLFGPEGLKLTDASWARANLRIYDIYEQLGGNAIGLRQLFRYKDDRFFVALDGVGGQWFGGTDDAHGFLLKLLVEKSVELPVDVKQAVAALGNNDLDRVLAEARDTMLSNRAFLLQGRSTVAMLEGDYNVGLGAPVVQAPPGIYVDNATVNGDGSLTVTLRTTGEAAIGPAQLLLFDNGRSFTPTDSFGIFVVRGSDAAEPPADDHGDDIASATAVTVGDSADGHLEQAGDTDVFVLTLASGGTLSVTSTGGSDLVGAILNAGGTAVASNDDGGGWYNFSVAQAVGAGTWYVRVRHCCDGTGAYRISTDLD